MATTTTQPFRLLDLPTELWLQILHHAIIQPSSITITAAQDLRAQEALVQQPPVTRTCRLLRQEALPLFYRLNDFEAHHSEGVACPRKWFRAVGLVNLREMGMFTFNAQFTAGFWAGNFSRMGIEVEVVEEESAVAMAKGTAGGGPGLQRLVVKFK